jgi:hypothetical protein
MSGAEAAGCCEVAYGAARDTHGLVMAATIGAGGVGVALFDEGAPRGSMLGSLGHDATHI